MGNPKAFLELHRQEAGYRPIHDRIHDFGEVEQTLSTRERKLQASRCMDCGVPFCHWACPLGNKAPEWNDALYKGDWELAYRLLNSTNPFPEFTGRICPALCEKACVLNRFNHEPTTNREDEAAITEAAFREGYIFPRVPARNGKRVAVIGAGPAGLAAADALNQMGYTVTVFEKNEAAGGLLRYGIPNFKLNKAIIDRRIALLEAEGITFRYGCNISASAPVSDASSPVSAASTPVAASTPLAASSPVVATSPVSAASAAVPEALASGSPSPSLPPIAPSSPSTPLSVAILSQQFDAVVLATGTPVARDLKAPGRSLKGVHFALELLSQQNRVLAGLEFSDDERITAKGKDVLVIGGGDTGSDCIGTAHRQGCNSVTQIEIMPRPVEGPDDPQNPWPNWPRTLKTTSSHEEGCTRRWNINTLEFLSAADIAAVPSSSLAPDSNNSPAAVVPAASPAGSSPVPSPDHVAAVRIQPIDWQPNPAGGRPLMVEAGPPEIIKAELVLLAMGFLKPDHPQYPANVFVCGDAANGASLVVRALASGLNAAKQVNTYVQGK